MGIDLVRDPGGDTGAHCTRAPAFVIRTGQHLGTICQQVALAPVDCRVLLMHALHLTRVQLITQSERTLSAEEAQQLSAVFQRRIEGEPVAYIVGEREFFGLAFHVTPAVLIPRPDTELLVELALAQAPHQARLLDLGTGSGAIAVAIAHQRPDLKVTALDVSRAALEVAAANAVRHGTAVELLHSDWYSTLGTRRFDLIVANPPYIVADDIHLSQGDLRFEPVDALTDHGDGLGDLRRIIAGALGTLEAGGWLLMEHGYDQAVAVRTLLGAHGFGDVQSWRDLSGIERVSGGTLSA
ncbi:MAG: peptide chain release factor N(5)-glutamine methyltransferase [Herminiimonas sp.]|nr:peptide chain release factor N(5)-glutamine methyltransferase [Herminiimonas sp.]